MITHGLKLHRIYAQGLDGRISDDLVEIRTIPPFKGNKRVSLNLSDIQRQPAFWRAVRGDRLGISNLDAAAILLFKRRIIHLYSDRGQHGLDRPTAALIAVMPI